MGRFVTEALGGESVSHGGSWVRLYGGLQQSKLTSLRRFIYSFSVRLFVSYGIRLFIGRSSGLRH